MIQRVLNFEAYFTIAVAAGIIAITDKLIPWFFGPSFYGYENCITNTKHVSRCYSRRHVHFQIIFNSTKSN